MPAHAPPSGRASPVSGAESPRNEPFATRQAFTKPYADLLGSWLLAGLPYPSLQALLHHAQENAQCRIERADNGDTSRAAALAGQGIVLQPSFLVGQDLASGKLVELLPRYSAGELGVYAVYPTRKHPPTEHP